MASAKRNWSAADVEAAIRSEKDPTKISLLEFAKKHGADGVIVAPGRKVKAAFGFYVKGRNSSNKVVPNITFVCRAETDALYLYNYSEDLLDKADVSEYHRRLIGLFENVFAGDSKEPNIPLANVRRHLADFEQLMLWLKEKAAKRLA